jgi:hypothetical protein
MLSPFNKGKANDPYVSVSKSQKAAVNFLRQHADQKTHEAWLYKLDSTKIPNEMIDVNTYHEKHKPNKKSRNPLYYEEESPSTASSLMPLSLKCTSGTTKRKR